MAARVIKKFTKLYDINQKIKNVGLYHVVFKNGFSVVLENKDDMKSVNKHHFSKIDYAFDELGINMNTNCVLLDSMEIYRVLKDVKKSEIEDIYYDNINNELWIMKKEEKIIIGKLIKNEDISSEIIEMYRNINELVDYKEWIRYKLNEEDMIKVNISSEGFIIDKDGFKFIMSKKLVSTVSKKSGVLVMFRDHDESEHDCLIECQELVYVKSYDLYRCLKF